MRLPDFKNDGDLLALRQKMGATRDGTFTTSYSPDSLTIEEIERLETGGIDVTLNDITPLDDGTLSYKNRRVIVYIRDVSVLGDQFSAPRFHVAHCRTLQDMKEKNKFGKYVVATRSNGTFDVNKIVNGKKLSSSSEKLLICQNCLDHLSFDGFSLTMFQPKRKKLVAEFTIEKFFEKYPRTLHLLEPVHTDVTAPMNEYPFNFNETSRRVREAKNWKCEKCDFVANENGEQKFLHVHHINGERYDSRPENFLVLCLGCHAKEPNHGHMRRLPGYREFANRYPRHA